MEAPPKKKRGRPKGSKNKKKKLVVLQKESNYVDISPKPQRRGSGGTFTFSNKKPTSQYHSQLTETLDPKRGRGRPPKPPVYKPKPIETLYTDIAPETFYTDIAPEPKPKPKPKPKRLTEHEKGMEMLKNLNPREEWWLGNTKAIESDTESDTDSEEGLEEGPERTGFIDGKEYYIGYTGKIYDMETEKEVPHLFGSKYVLNLNH